MFDILLDAVIDSIKLLPFLFITFLILEYIEHKSNINTRNKISKSGKLGPLFGSLIGIIPQCGFSVSATNLYATRVITLGTLISVYLSTSDEMLPIMLSTGASIKLILLVLVIKFIIGMTFGFVIDLVFFRKKENLEITDFCDEEHCHCEKGILHSSIHHTLNIFIFIFVINIIFNVCLYYFEDSLISMFDNIKFITPVVSSLIGLIPNCASSIVITELYLNKVIGLGALIAGLLVNSGVGLGVLFKVNKNFKENMLIILTLLTIGIICGYFIEWISLLV